MSQTLVFQTLEQQEGLTERAKQLILQSVTHKSFDKITPHYCTETKGLNFFFVTVKYSKSMSRIKLGLYCKI